MALSQSSMRKNGQANLRVVEFDPQTFVMVSASNIVKVGPSATDISVTNCLVKQPGPLAITTTALPAGKVGVAYNQTLAASGGVPGYHWILNTGSNPLPAGLKLNPFGVISGTPTTAGTTVLTVKVTDAASGTVSKPLTLTITAGEPSPRDYSRRHRYLKEPSDPLIVRPSLRRLGRGHDRGRWRVGPYRQD